MPPQQSVSALRVADEAFLVASLIERCPKTMMLRELMMNALEASRSAPEGHRLVDIYTTTFSGTPKLTIWNTGFGMDAAELLQISDIASSVRKEKSLHGNFGMGAKVASLPANQLGMRYRSCKDGHVHEVVLCKKDGVYGRLRRLSPETGDYVEVADVTELAKSEGQKVEHDWTEVVLLGNRADQNTAKDPYDGDPEQDAQWLATYLYHRFYRLPPGVRITLRKGTHKLDNKRHFLPISGRSKIFERSESVETDNGIIIHYIYDAPYDKSTGSGHNRSISGAVASAVSTCAIVFKDERYDVRKGRNWTFDAPLFGIPFGARHISVHIELPDQFEVVPDAYRQFLRYAAGEQPHVLASDFAELVRTHRPDWLIEIIRNFAPDGSSSEDIRSELQKLLNSLRVRRVSPRVTPQGLSSADTGPGPAGGPGGDGRAEASKGGERAIDLSVLPSGAKRASMFDNLERAPEIIPLHDEVEVEEKGFKGRAARYVMGASQLFVNMNYSAVQEMRSHLEAEYPDASDVEAMRSLAKQHSERTMIVRVGRTVVYALAKQLNKEWDQKALEVASSPESLSMAADDYLDAMQSARRAIGKALRMSRVAPEVPSDEAA